MNATDLTGRTAIITGASRGIGLATAHALAAAGANVVMTSRSQQSADAAAETITGPGVALGVGAHSVDEDQAQHCIDLTMHTFGRIDILVNNAGTNPAYGPLLAQDRGRFSKTFDVNLWAPLLWTRLAADAWMSKHGGTVVNTASIGGMVHEAKIGMYNASKSALLYVTRQLSLELAPNIRVNAVAPGVVRTKLAEALWRDHESEVSASTPLNRIGEPEDVASAIAFLVSDAAAWITGETMVIDGGQRLGEGLDYLEPGKPHK